MTVAATWIHGRRSPDVMSAATAARGGRVTTVRPLCDRLAHDNYRQKMSNVCTCSCVFVASRVAVVLSRSSFCVHSPLGSFDFVEQCLKRYSSNIFSVCRNLRHLLRHLRNVFSRETRCNFNRVTQRQKFIIDEHISAYIYVDIYS